MALISVVSLLVGGGCGFWLASKRAEPSSIDSHVESLGEALLMYDALSHNRSDLLEAALVARIEGAISGIALGVGDHSAESSEFARCVTTRKVRQLAQEQRVLADKARLEGLGYPYDQVAAYLADHCPGAPSHDDWSSITKN
jgi:hypothetical protein